MEITFLISWNLLFLQTFMPTIGNRSSTSQKQVFLFIGASLVGKTHQNLWHIFQQSKIENSSKYKLNFWLVKTIVSYFFQTLLPLKVTFTSSENVSLMNASFRLVETHFLSSGNSMLLFRDFFPAVGNHEWN